jgi:hypothetical protein
VISVRQRFDYLYLGEFEITDGSFRFASVTGHMWAEGERSEEQILEAVIHNLSEQACVYDDSKIRTTQFLWTDDPFDPDEEGFKEEGP